MGAALYFVQKIGLTPVFGDRSNWSTLFASSTVYAVNSYLFLAGNLRKREDFQFEVFTVSKTVCLSYQPSDLVVESLPLGVADMPEGPGAIPVFFNFAAGFSPIQAQVWHKPSKSLFFMTVAYAALPMSNPTKRIFTQARCKTFLTGAFGSADVFHPWRY